MNQEPSFGAIVKERRGLLGLTQGEVVLGSPAYISPEQILAEPVKPQPTSTVWG